jgi:hypothetical protein
MDAPVCVRSAPYTRRAAGSVAENAYRTQPTQGPARVMRQVGALWEVRYGQGKCLSLMIP